MDVVDVSERLGTALNDSKKWMCWWWCVCSCVSCGTLKNRVRVCSCVFVCVGGCGGGFCIGNGSKKKCR